MTGQHGGGAWISFQAQWKGNEEFVEGQASVWPMSGHRPERRRLLRSRQEEVVAWSGAVVPEGEKRRRMGVKSLLPLLSPARLVMNGCHVKTEPQV